MISDLLGTWWLKPLAIGIFCTLLFGTGYYKGYEHEKTLFDTFKAQVFAEDKIQEDKKNEAAKKQAEIDKVNNKQITDLHINQETLINAIKEYYAPHYTKSTMVHGIGIVLPSSANSSQNQVAGSGQDIASSEQIPNTTCAGLQTQLETLEEAAALETILYNKAKSRIDQDCEQVGCE